MSGEFLHMARDILMTEFEFEKAKIENVYYGTGGVWKKGTTLDYGDLKAPTVDEIIEVSKKLFNTL